MSLKIAGDGPMADEVNADSHGNIGIEWLGRVSRERVVELMKGAAVLVFPSVWYETFGMSIIEAFAVGLPVIASKIGVVNSLVDHERTGLHFLPGNAVDLAAQVEWMLAHPSQWRQMRRNARAEFEAKYTAKTNYETLIRIYESAIDRVKSERTTL